MEDACKQGTSDPKNIKLANSTKSTRKQRMGGNAFAHAFIRSTCEGPKHTPKKWKAETGKEIKVHACVRYREVAWLVANMPT